WNADGDRPVAMGGTRRFGGAVRGAFDECEADGAGYVSRVVGRRDVRGGDSRGQLYDEAQAGFGAGGFGLLVHRDSVRRQVADVAAACILGRRGGHDLRDTEYHLLVKTCDAKE